MVELMREKLNVSDICKALSLSISKTMRAEQIWRYLISPNTLEKYETQLNIYIPFFNGVRQSAFITTILGLAKFSDTQNNAANAIILLNLLREYGLCATQLDKLKGLYEEHSKTWKKIIIVRHNIVAHISTTISENDAFDKARITPDQISSALEAAYEILKISEESLGMSNTELTFDPGATKRDINKLFKNLEKGREAKGFK